MVCLGLEPGAAGLKQQTNPLIYGGIPEELLIFVRLYFCYYDITDQGRLYDDIVTIDVTPCWTSAIRTNVEHQRPSEQQISSNLTHKHVTILGHRGGSGQAVSVLAFFCDDPSSNATRCKFFFWKLFEKIGSKLKRYWDIPFLWKLAIHGLFCLLFSSLKICSL